MEAPAQVRTDPRSLLPAELARQLQPLSLAVRRPQAGHMRGERRSTKRGSSVEFADYRTYAPGDDLRRVDWNLYARADRLYLKLYEEEEDRAVHILMDTSASMTFGSPSKLECARRLAAAIGYVALNDLDRVQLAGIGGETPRRARPLRGHMALGSMLEFLASLDGVGAGSLSRGLDRYAGSVRTAGTAIILSDLMDPEGVERGLRALAGRGHELVVLHVLSQEDLEPSLAGDLELVDCETQERRPLTVDNTALELYQAELERWLAEVRRLCASLSAPYVLVRSDAPVEHVLFSDLRKAKVLV